MEKILLLTLAIGLLSCEKDVSIEDQIVGTWYMPQPLNRHTAGKSVTDVGEHSLSAWNYSQIVTTNSDQELIDRMAEAKGAITLSGTVNEDIKYIFYNLNKRPPLDFTLISFKFGLCTLIFRRKPLPFPEGHHFNPNSQQ